MAGVLTTGSNVVCGHGGTVSTSGSDKLKVSGNPVLQKPGIAGQAVSACGTPAASDVSGPTAIPCSSVTSVASGEATKLTINGTPVMLDTLSGQTDGMVGKVTPQLLLSATAVQSKLKAV